MAKGKLILSRNQWFRQDMPWQIELSRDSFAGVRRWGGPRMVDSKNTIIFRNK